MMNKRQSSPHSPKTRAFQFLAHLPEHSYSIREARPIHSAYSKVKIIPSVQFGTRQRVRPLASQSPPTPRSFYSLGLKTPRSMFRKDISSSTRLPTANPSLHSYPNSASHSLIDWVSKKKKTLLTSLALSCESPLTRLDRDLSLSQTGAVTNRTVAMSVQKSAEKQRKPGEIKTVRSMESLHREKRTLKVPTERFMPIPKPVLETTKRPRVGQILIEKASLKEANRDREWTLKALDQLTKDWHSVLRLSNGVTVAPPSEAYFSYTYHLGRGNNHPLVGNCFKSRGIWVRAEGEDSVETANLVWTQSKLKYVFKWLPTASSEEIEAAPRVASGLSIICTVKLTHKTNLKKPLPVDISPLGYDLVTQSPSFLQLSPSLVLESQDLQTHNKLEHNYHLTNKKTLFLSLKTYCETVSMELFDLIPVTFHIVDGLADPNFDRFQAEFTSRGEGGDARRLKGLWIVKPGENTNRGTGITVCSSLEQVKNVISVQTLCPISGSKRTFILQKYIENPLLISRRKFDIRCFVLVTAINGVVQGYFYQEGYLRTSSKEFSLKDVGNRFVHLTNDAVQKHSEDYGRFEAGNKLSYSDFQRYLSAHALNKSVNLDILPQLRSSIKVSLLAAYPKLNADSRQYSFELLGYDFMLDATGKAWLIEVNTNPCLEMSSPLLARVIPAMLDNAFRIAVDPYFPEPPSSSNRKAPVSLTGESIPENKFELLFNSLTDGLELKRRLGPLFARLTTFDPALQDMQEESFQASSDSES